MLDHHRRTSQTMTCHALMICSGRVELGSLSKKCSTRILSLPLHDLYRPGFQRIQRLFAKQQMGVLIMPILMTYNHQRSL
jgi:hypothetical protein